MRRRTVFFLALITIFYFLTVGAQAVELTVGTSFITERIGKADWVLLDTRPAEDYQQGHMPGAVNLGKKAASVLRDSTERAYTIVPSIEKTLGAAGISDDKNIIVYGKAADAYTNTVPFWILEYLGCNSGQAKCTVHYYDGGIEKWQADGGKIEQGSTTPAPAKFKAHVIPQRLATTEEILKIVNGKEKAYIMDTRTEAEFNGTDIRALRGGHIPGAINLKVQKNYDGKTFLMLPLADLAALYKDLPKDARVIVHCQTGTRSTYTYLVLRMLGYSNVANYDDSWRVYGNNINFPVENEQWFDYAELNNTLKGLKEKAGAK